MTFLLWFLSGALLCNAVPHFVAGLLGMPFPTPFATPHGVGNSSPVVNVLWGFANGVAGLLLISVFPATIGLNFQTAAFGCGVLLLGVAMAWHFGKVRSG